MRTLALVLSLAFAAPAVVSEASGPAASETASSPLIVLKRSRPIYPAIAAVHGISGSVAVCFTVEADGTVSHQHAKSVKTNASPRYPDVFAKVRSSFIAASEDAIRDWKFSPQRVNGQPVATPDVCQRFNFSA